MTGISDSHCLSISVYLTLNMIAIILKIILKKITKYNFVGCLAVLEMLGMIIASRMIIAAILILI